MLTSQQNMRNEMQLNNEVVQGMQSAKKEHKANMDMMNKQLSQLATSVGEMKWNSGILPSTVHIPEKANVSKIALRSGTSYKGPEMKKLEKEPNPQVMEQAQIGKRSSEVEEEKTQLPRRSGLDKTGSVIEPLAEAEKKDSEEVIEIPREAAKGEKPFPYRFVTKRKKEDPVDYLSIFGKLDVTIPFLQSVKLPPLGKFIKEFIAGKAEEDGKIMVQGIDSTIVHEKLPPKRADPGMFTLPKTIEDVKIEHAMCDLGASINVMPYAIYNRLKGVKLTSTTVLIQLSDRSRISPEGGGENVLVKVHDFLYLADFHVIRMSEPEASESSGILLGKTFLRTA
ncbi:uncharacterized protein LOC121784293 [Salvia splendens]|uniref:uncharacterized protein LOC121784293 n=1 Tax=Salvia splendens TaxID=180675 RepID=UPI001C271EF1|nr:uncharacterized protein LOC121784293 [Salvia splendens]